MTFAAAVVVYNMFCGDSPTCKALEKLAQSSLLVLIYDNSTKDFGNRAYCAEQGWVYLGGTGNAGISKAYNACINYLTDGSKVDMLCLFDDDTHIDPTYFTMLEQAGKDAKENIFVPLIFANNTLISPCVLDNRHHVTLFSNEQAALNYSANELSAINSCMALRLSLFSHWRYDENVFLDGVDHNFILEMRQKGEPIRVFPYRCDHAFSGVEKPSLKSALVRFRIYAKDYNYILRDNKLAYLRLVGKRALRLTVQYRTLAFIKSFFNVQTEKRKEAL